MPPIPCPSANTNTAISVLTSVGFRRLELDDYLMATRKLKPDIVVGLGDMINTREPGRNRRQKMSERTAEWTQKTVNDVSSIDGTGQPSATSFFAPILPFSRELQSFYLDQLADELSDRISGLAIYDANILSELPESLLQLPRLSFTEPSSPNRILHEVSHGMDLSVVPFIGAATDAGIALDFSFPAPSSDAPSSARQPLGIDMWSSKHATDVSPLRAGCSCYACTKHHRAYVQHLLSAKEMLGWVLLQMHNHRVVDAFFAGIRDSIGRGSFEEDRLAFERVYEPELPEKTGQGPR